MGYQVVDATTTDYKTKRGIVYNAELLTLDKDRNRDRVIMLTKSVTEVPRAADTASGAIKR